MRILFKMVLAPISLFVAFLALMAKWLLTLSSYIARPRRRRMSPAAQECPPPHKNVPDGGLTQQR